jgi:multidrug efflux system outer membrane protein
MKSYPLFASSLLVILCGCAVGPDYSTPETVTPPTYSMSSAAAAETPDLSESGHWADLFDDAKLAALIRAARENNHSLAALYQNTLRARALIRSETAAGRPQLDSAANYTRSEVSEEVNQFNDGEETYEAALALNWEIDLFGRVARQVEAATAEAEAAEALYQDFLLLTETDVAINYFRLAALAREIEVVQQSVGTRREALDIVKRRFESGAVSNLDVAQSQTLLAESEAELSVLRRERDTRKHALAVLTGQMPTGRKFEVNFTASEPAAPPVGIPAELLQKRPDLRQAERALAAANARVGVATANFYPRITLGGNSGFATLDANDWFQNSAGFYNYGPEIYLPIFQGGRLRAELSQSEYAYAESLERYRQAVLEAFAEVEDALTGSRHLAEQRRARERAAEAASRAQRISNDQYRNGLIDFTTALDSERVALDAERRLAQVIGDQYENTIRLIRAIGGTWSGR